VARNHRHGGAPFDLNAPPLSFRSQRCGTNATTPKALAARHSPHRSSQAAGHRTLRSPELCRLRSWSFRQPWPPGAAAPARDSEPWRPGWHSESRQGQAGCQRKRAEPLEGARGSHRLTPESGQPPREGLTPKGARGSPRLTVSAPPPRGPRQRSLAARPPKAKQTRRKPKPAQANGPLSRSRSCAPKGSCAKGRGARERERPPFRKPRSKGRESEPPPHTIGHPQAQREPHQRERHASPWATMREREGEREREREREGERLS